MRPHEARIISKWPDGILPESYLYGLADVRLAADFYTSYLLGRSTTRNMVYFPVAFAIKSTLRSCPHATVVAAIATRRLNCWREICF